MRLLTQLGLGWWQLLHVECALSDTVLSAVWANVDWQWALKRKVDLSSASLMVVDCSYQLAPPLSDLSVLIDPNSLALTFISVRYLFILLFCSLVFGLGLGGNKWAIRERLNVTWLFFFCSSRKGSDWIIIESGVGIVSLWVYLTRSLWTCMYNKVTSWHQHCN